MHGRHGRTTCLADMLDLKPERATAHQVPRDPARDEADGDEGKLVQLGAGKLGQGPHEVGQHQPREHS